MRRPRWCRHLRVAPTRTRHPAVVVDIISSSARSPVNCVEVSMTTSRLGRRSRSSAAVSRRRPDRRPRRRPTSRRDRLRRPASDRRDGTGRAIVPRPRSVSVDVVLLSARPIRCSLRRSVDSPRPAPVGRSIMRDTPTYRPRATSIAHGPRSRRTTGPRRVAAVTHGSRPGLRRRLVEPGFGRRRPTVASLPSDVRRRRRPAVGDDDISVCSCTADRPQLPEPSGRPRSPCAGFRGRRGEPVPLASTDGALFDPETLAMDRLPDAPFPDPLDYPQAIAVDDEVVVRRHRLSASES